MFNGTTLPVRKISSQGGVRQRNLLFQNISVNAGVQKRQKFSGVVYYEEAFNLVLVQPRREKVLGTMLKGVYWRDVFIRGKSLSKERIYWRQT